MTNPFTHPTDALLPHRMSVPWHDTLGYYQKRWPDRATPPRPKPAITGRKAYKSYVASYTQQNSQEIPGFSGLSLLFNFVPQLTADFQRHGGLKIHLATLCAFFKSGVGHTTDWVPGHMHRIYHLHDDELQSTLADILNETREGIEHVEQMGSGWVFARILTLEMHVARYKPLKGAGRFKTPPKLRNKLAVVNVDVEGDECFKWAILSGVFPADKDTARPSKYKKHMEDLDSSHALKGFTLPSLLRL